MRVIDVHNHFYPPEYITAIKSRKSVVKVTMGTVRTYFQLAQ